MRSRCCASPCLRLGRRDEDPRSRDRRAEGQDPRRRACNAALGTDPDAAQLVAAECVVEGETKDHMNWEFIGEAADALSGNEAKVLKEAYDEVEEEGRRAPLPHDGLGTRAVARVLGLPAVLPPPRKRSTSRPPSAPPARSSRARRCFESHDARLARANRPGNPSRRLWRGRERNGNNDTLFTGFSAVVIIVIIVVVVMLVMRRRR